MVPSDSWDERAQRSRGCPIRSKRQSLAAPRPRRETRQVELPDGRLLASRRSAGTRAADGAAWTVWLFVGLEALRRRDQAPLSRLSCPGSVARRCPQRIARQATERHPSRARHRRRQELLARRPVARRGGGRRTIEQVPERTLNLPLPAPAGFGPHAARGTPRGQHTRSPRPTRHPAGAVKSAECRRPLHRGRSHRHRPTG